MEKVYICTIIWLGWSTQIIVWINCQTYSPLLLIILLQEEREYYVIYILQRIGGCFYRTDNENFDRNEGTEVYWGIYCAFFFIKYQTIAESITLSVISLMEKKSLNASCVTLWDTPLLSGDNLDELYKTACACK